MTKTIVEVKKLEKLLAEGKALLGHPSQSHRGTSPGLLIPLNEIDWIGRSLNFLYEILPATTLDSEFPAVNAIRSSYNPNQSIVTTEHNQHIKEITICIEKCLSFLNWLVKFGKLEQPIPSSTGYYIALRNLYNYIQKEFSPKLVGIEKVKTKNTAILHLFGRVIVCVHGLLKLDDPKCCQSLLATLRTLLELYLDIFLIHNDVIENGVEKFYSFEASYRLRSAKALKRIDGELQEPRKEFPELEGTLSQDALITKNTTSLWSKEPSKIQHWSDLIVEERARKTEQLSIYRDIYYFSNWYVHSGYTEFPRSEGDANFLRGYTYQSSISMVLDIVKVIVLELGQYKDVLRECEKIYLYAADFVFWQELKRNSAQ